MKRSHNILYIMIGYIMYVLFQKIKDIIIYSQKLPKRELVKLIDTFDKIGLLVVAAIIVVLFIIIRGILTNFYKTYLFWQLNPLKLKKYIERNFIINRYCNSEFTEYFNASYYYLFSLLLLNDKKEYEKTLSVVKDKSSPLFKIDVISLIECLSLALDGQKEKFDSLYLEIEKAFKNNIKKRLNLDQLDLFNLLKAIHYNQEYKSKRKLYTYIYNYLTNKENPEIKTSTVSFLNPAYEFNDIANPIKRRFFTSTTIFLIIMFVFGIGLSLAYCLMTEKYWILREYEYASSDVFRYFWYSLMIYMLIVNVLYLLRRKLQTNFTSILALVICILSTIVYENITTLAPNFFFFITLYIFAIGNTGLTILNLIKLRYEYYGIDEIDMK